MFNFKTHFVFVLIVHNISASRLAVVNFLHVRKTILLKATQMLELF